MIYHSAIFSGVRFFLAGFPPPQHLEAKSKLVSEGGVYLEEYGPECTHVIVDNIILDDPICVAAKRDKKVLVTSLWIEDSFDSGGPADPNSLLYCPPKDLNGIPGANKFFMSLTGFHGQERDDIRTMVGLMGAHFSKAMVAHKVTHLICLKFEGEKYELAKRIGSTKIVNMYWLEDCLKSWSLLAEEHYSKSTYEVRMEAEVKDSEDEAEAEVKDVIGRKTTGVTHLQTELGKAHNHSVLATKVSIPPAQQGFPNNSSINAEMPTESKNGNMPDKQSDMVTESVNDKLDKQPFRDYGALFQMHTKSGYFDFQDVKSNQIENGLPSISGNAKNSCDFDANLISNHSKTTLKTSSSSSKKTAQSNSSLKTSPSSSKPLSKTSLKTSPSSLKPQSKASLKTSPSSLKPQSKASLKTSPSSSKSQSKTSMKTAGEYGKSDGRLSKDLAEKVVDEVPTFNLETDTEEAASGGFGGLSTEWLADSSAGKHSLSNSKESPSIFSLSLQSTRDLTCQDGKEDKGLSEKVIADVCTFNVGKTALASGTSSAQAGLFGVDLKDPGGKLPQKRAADSNVSHTTPKSQKLASSTSKRVDAAEPKTRVNNPLKKSKTGMLNSGCQIADESAELSPYSSAKSNANNAAPSRSLSSDVLQGSKPANIEPLTSPNTKTGSPLLVDDNSKGQLQNRHENDADFSGTNDFKAVKSGSTKLNCGDSNGNVSKSSRKKMVARKTLGSRPKANKEKVDAQGVSISRSSEADDSVGQENREEFALSPASDKNLSSSTAGEPNHLGAKPHLDSSTKINHIADPLVDNTEDRSELDIRNEKLQTAEQSHFKMHVAETVGMAKNLGAQKKGRGIKANRKNLLAAKEASKDADNVEGGKSSSDKVKEPVHSVAVKKIQGLNKSKQSVEVENKLDCNACVEVGRESEPFLNDQNVTKGLHCSGKLSLNKNRGVPVVNKPEDPVEVENDPLFDSNKGQSGGKKCPGKLTASSNTAQGDEEDKNKNDPAVGDDKGTSKVAKFPQKLVGKKRRGTVLLKKSHGIDEAEEENESVYQVDQHPRKLAGASGILDRPGDDGKENDPFIGNSKGRNKGAGNLTGKKRRGTLVLNDDEAHLTEEGKMNKSDEDQSKTEKLTSKSKLTANKNDASSGLNTRELKEVKNQSACFILSGHRLQRKEFQKLIRNLRGKVCRDSHQWSYQASHFIVPDPIRRTEKFFAAAASGSWILKTDYLTASSQAGKFLPEEPYEWHKSGLNEDGAISLEAPRKWRLLRERTGHGAFYGMRIVIYGECVAPPLETLKRAVNAGDGTILATSPPYTRFLESGIHYAIISPGIPRVDIWIQEFLRHQIPCVLADYLVEYVCKPGYSLDRHVQYNTHEWAAKSSSKLLSLSEEVVVDAVAVTTPDDQVSDDLACKVCGSIDRAEVMLVCGNETGSIGCGIGTHIDCCDPPLEDVPEEDWFCPKCSEPVNKLPGSRKKKQFSQKR